MRALCWFLVLGACGGGQAVATPDAAVADVATDAVVDSRRALCVDGKSVDGEYPKAELEMQMGKTPPDLAFDSVTDDGTATKVSLHEYYEPCAAQSRVLLVRMTAGWCGTCRWDLAHTKEFLSSAVAPRVQLLDLILANDDNEPAVRDDLKTLRARTAITTRAALDPAFRFAPARLSPAPLPTYALLDTRTMRILVVLDNPELEELIERVGLELNELDGGKPKPGSIVPRVDGLTRKQWELLRDIRLPGAPPPDPTNAKADDSAAATLGKQLYSETALSPSGTVSCATCHDPNKSFADGRAQSTGVSLGDRNAPSVLFASHARWQFLDGRADSLWAQATGPFENPKEAGSNRLFVAHAVFAKYRAAYEAIFGVMPPLNDSARFPANGKPGDASWTAMTEADRTAATRVFVNVAKAIAAFERTLRAKPNALDRYIGGESLALTPAQKVGLKTFFTAGCIQCHYGPRLTNDAFHALRFPTGRIDRKPDDGRASGIASLLASEFRSDGPFSDAPATRPLGTIANGAWTVGAFRTPPLRGISTTGPYGHGGTTATLRDMAKLYSTAGLKAGDPLTIGEREPWVSEFVDGHIDELDTFMRVLSADPE